MTNGSALTSIAPALPEIFLALAGMGLLLAGAFRERAQKQLPWFEFAIGVFIAAAFLVLRQSWEPSSTLNGMFAVNEFIGFMKLLVLGGMIAATALSIPYAQQEKIGRFEYPVLMIFAALGMTMMISANSLLALYVALELQSLSLYVLTALQTHNTRSSEAGLKYFVLGALASGMLLFGISLVYGYTGSVDFEGITTVLKGSAVPHAGLITGMVFILAGIAFKISAVPFHMWTPDVYEGAPTSVTALFAMVPKIAALSLLIRVLDGPFSSLMPQWQQVIWCLAAASVTWGAFAGLAQKNIKRLMAYSSIGNMGYALIGIVTGTSEGISAVIIYMTIYLAMTAGVFGIILTMRRRGMALENIEDLAGLSRTSPLRAWSMAFLMLSMTGIPPLAGFFGKLFIFQAAVAQNFMVLAVIGVLASVVAAYYYLKIIKVMFMDEPISAFDAPLALPLRAIIFLSVAFVLLFILSPAFLVEAGRAAAAAVFAG